MEAEDAFSMDLMGPSAEDKANGAALLSAALVREAGALAQAAAGLRAALDLADSDSPRDEARRAAAMAAALLLIARQLRLAQLFARCSAGRASKSCGACADGDCAAGNLRGFARGGADAD
jgi:hypothetical protein